MASTALAGMVDCLLATSVSDGMHNGQKGFDLGSLHYSVLLNEAANALWKHRVGVSFTTSEESAGLAYLDHEIFMIALSGHLLEYAERENKIFCSVNKSAQGTKKRGKGAPSCGEADRKSLNNVPAPTDFFVGVRLLARKQGRRGRLVLHFCSWQSLDHLSSREGPSEKARREKIWCGNLFSGMCRPPRCLASTVTTNFSVN
ncbi:uncharacterized protein BDZ83DRAFT_177223 [Colletotrichum acutatum]|uniref:Uncharacterized protein n=1 Tax=Glomerella acutata TaxID=27357 RepID=A0AAD8XJV3_GLOAC|nr:uncharacterized protein BDZ83DRAFT_177223 [Colletotrichum acutatum]KAK1727830.1 hypothetical protein BDZ83DRAFT_177223 [Colletotrichum acutatum]